LILDDLHRYSHLYLAGIELLPDFGRHSQPQLVQPGAAVADRNLPFN